MDYRSKVIQYAPTARKLLKGVFAIHKPKDWGSKRILNNLKTVMCEELNSMRQQPPSESVQILGTFKEQNFSVVKYRSPSDSSLTLGPRYIHDDLKLSLLTPIPFMSSGLCLLALHPKQQDLDMFRKRMINTYELQCEFGYFTEDGTTMGRVIDRSRYDFMTIGILERCLSSITSQHQRGALANVGVDLLTQEAYERACKGLVKPDHRSIEVIYDLRCTKFDPPYFTIELQTINEHDQFLRRFIHDLATKLKTTAVIDKMRRLRVGPFTLDQALIKNHWTLENIVDNIQELSGTLNDLYYPELMQKTDTSKPELTLLKKVDNS